MRHILAEDGKEVLAQYAWSNVLCAFDFDGTLAPIVAEPGAARMRAETRRLLDEVIRLYPCAVISGRAHDDVRGRLEGLPLSAISGNHGLEPWEGASRYEDLVRSWLEVLTRDLIAVQGVFIEDKRYSIAVHYRKCRDRSGAVIAIRKSIGSLEGARCIGGHCVLNVVPQGIRNKGTALDRMRRHFGCDTAIYLGDDETDEDVFSLDQPGRLLGIRVGRSAKSLAPFFLRNQLEVDDLCGFLASFRKSAAFRGRRGARR